MCPLCSSTQVSLYHTDNKRNYFHCEACKLVFVDPVSLPDRETELAEYLLHNNDANDLGYRNFLSRIIPHVVQSVDQTTNNNSSFELLDFGCGPNPLLSQLFAELGFSADFYDSMFFPDDTRLRKQYDIIVSTEAIEHFHTPIKEWELWLSMLKPQGLIAIMTKRVIDKQRFSTWHYKNDITHVSFFSEQTFNWLAHKYGLSVSFPSSDIVLLKNQN